MAVSASLGQSIGCTSAIQDAHCQAFVDRLSSISLVGAGRNGPRHVLVFLSFWQPPLLLCGLPKRHNIPRWNLVASLVGWRSSVWNNISRVFRWVMTCHDLSGSQSMSVAVQFFVVAIAGLFTVSLSDRIGRPALIAGYLSNLRYVCLCLVPKTV